MTINAITSTRGQEMLTYLPRYYETSRVVGSIIHAQGLEFERLRQSIDEVFNQFFVNTATWGLEKWEQELAITPAAGKPEDQRRAVIRSKIRGIGNVTLNLIDTVADSYDGGKVDVIKQPELYQFTVKFVDTKGIPPNLHDLKAVIEEIKPAHLKVEYQFTYTTWGEVKNTTWGTVQSGTWGELRTRQII